MADSKISNLSIYVSALSTDIIPIVDLTSGITKKITKSDFQSGLLLSSNNLSDVASASASRSNLGLAIGSNVQAYSSNLDAWSLITTASKLNSNGSIAMTGNLDLGGNNAVNANLVKVNDGGGLYNTSNNAHINLESDGHIDFTATGISASTVPYFDASKNLISSSVTPTELGYLSGVTSSLQNQINNINAGLSWKSAVRAATTANVTLSGTQTIDGVAVIAGDRVLVKNQSTASQNGIYVCASGSWSRSTDSNTGTSILQATVSIEEGSVNADTIYTCTTDAPITIGTTSITFAKTSATTYTGSAGVSLSGNNFTLDNSYFTGEISLSGGSGTLLNSAVIGKVLTGYVSGAGTVASTDTILGAIQKLNGNIAALVTGVSSVSGTTNRITSTGGSTPVIDISASYVGQSSITTLGTITTGVWSGTSIAYSKLSLTGAILNADLAGGIDLTTKVTGLLPDGNIASAATWNAKQAALVSGTNIKTVNGSTLLGSGNLAVGDALLAGTNSWTGLNTFSLSPSVPTPVLNTDAVSKFYADQVAYNYPAYGNIINETFANLTNWTITNPGSSTFTVASNQLTVSNSSGSLLLTDYIIQSAYGTCNADGFTADFDLIPGTINSTSWGASFNLQSQLPNTNKQSIQIVIKLDTTSLGKIGYYYNNLPSVTSISPGALGGISTGDVIKVRIRYRENKIVTTIWNSTASANTGISHPLEIGLAYPNLSFGVMNTWNFGIGACGGTHKVQNFKTNLTTPVGADAMFIGDSICYGYYTDNIAYRATYRLADRCKETIITYAKPGIRIDDLNTTEILNLKPKKIIIQIGTNNVGSPQNDTPATYISKLQTFVNTLVAQGYVVGQSIFFLTLLPRNDMASSVITNANAQLITTYGQYCTDIYTTFNNGAGQLLTTNTPDGIHPNVTMNKALGDIYFNMTDASGNRLFTDKGNPRLGFTPIMTNPLTGYAYVGGNSGIAPNYTFESIDATGKSQIHFSGSQISTGGGGYLTSSAAGIAQLSGGAAVDNGSAWTAKTTAAGIISIAPTSTTAGIGFYCNDNTTSGSTFVPTQIANFTSKGLGIFSSAPNYALDVVQTSGATQIRFGAGTGDTGGYLSSAGSGFANLSNAAYNGTNWVAKGTTSGILGISSASAIWYFNSGLTSGSTFTPTSVITLDATGVSLNVVGAGMKIKGGTNARIGQATLVAGTVTVANTSVTANTRIFPIASAAGGTQGILSTSKSVGTSFTITSTSATETSTLDWILVEQQ